MKTFLLCLLAGFITSITFADTWKDPETGITWSYSVSNGKASIGATPSSGAITIPSTLGGYPVTKIGSGAFAGSRGLTSVTIPEGVTTIGGYAFSRCDSLSTITIPESVISIGFKAFNACELLQFQLYTDSKGAVYDSPKRKVLIDACKVESNDFIIPSSVNVICGGALPVKEWKIAKGNQRFVIVNGLLLSKDRKRLFAVRGRERTSITIPSSVTSIESGAFVFYRGLVSITLPEDLTHIGDAAFFYCFGLTSVTIPSSVTSIGDSAFLSCGLTSVTIPSSVTSIGDSAFRGCRGLTSVTILGEVTTIGNGAFESIAPEKLTSAFIPEGMKLFRLTSWTIPEGATAIKYCEQTKGSEDSFYFISRDKEDSINIQISSITLPSTVKSIGKDVFSKFKALTSITIPDSVTEIEASAFRNCEALTTVTLPKGLTAIKESTFSECGALTSITIPEGVTSIGAYAFGECGALTSITIPEGVTSIGDGAFSECFNLFERVVIPSTVTEIGEGVFARCTSLGVVEFRCPPPKATLSPFLAGPLDNSPISIQGFYTWGNASAWRKRLASGKWHGIEMSMKGTWVLYLGGILLLLAGGAGGFLFYKKRKEAQSISE